MALTSDDKQFIKQQLKPLADELTELSARLKELERSTDTLAFLGKNSNIIAIEKRTARIEGKLEKLATKEDVNRIPTKVIKELKPILENYEERLQTHEQKMIDVENELDGLKRLTA
jgi:23S rRNA maturation-related 3'-5' exoribonuclease YhaM